MKLDIIKKLKNSKLINILIPIIFSAIFFGVLIHRNGIVYVMNDDIVMRSIVSGGFTGKPSTRMIFSIFPYSTILMLLYTITNELDWYGIMLTSLTIFFLTYTVYSVIKEQDSIYKKIIYAFLIYLIIVLLFEGFFVELTFTIIATFIITCCLILYFLPSNKIKNIIMGIGIVLSFGIRYKACAMVLIFFLPALLYKNAHNKENFIKDVILGAKIFAVIVVCFIIENKIIMKDWKDYFEYFEYGSLFYDYLYERILSLPEDQRVQIFHEAGFDDNEMQMLCNYGARGFYDDIQYKIKDLMEAFERHNVKIEPEMNLTWTKPIIKQSKLFKCSVASFVILEYFVIRSKDKRKIFITLLFPIFQMAILGYIMSQGRIVDRVISPLMFSFVAMNVFMIFSEAEAKKVINAIIQYDRITITVCIMILLVIFTRKINIRKSYIYDLTLSELSPQNSIILKYLEENQDKKYIHNQFNLEKFEIRNKYHANNYICMTGWPVYTPIYKECLKRFGADSLRELLFKDDVYIILYSPEIDTYQLLGVEAKAELVDNVNGIYFIYKFTK